MMINVAMLIPYNVATSTLDNGDIDVSTQLDVLGLSFDNDPNVNDADRRFCIYEYDGTDGYKHYKIIANGYIYRAYMIGISGSIEYGLTQNPNAEDYQEKIANLLSKPSKLVDTEPTNYVRKYVGALNDENGMFEGGKWFDIVDVKPTFNLEYTNFNIGEKPDLSKDSGKFEITTESKDGIYLSKNNMSMQAPIIKSDNDATFYLRYKDSEYPQDTDGYPYLMFIVGDGNSITLNNWEDVDTYIKTGELPWQENEDDDNNATSDTGSKDVDDSFEDMSDNDPSTTAITTQCTNWYYITKDQLQECLNFFWTITDDWTALIFNQFTGLYSNLSQCMIQLKYVPHSYANVVSQGIENANILIGKYTSDATGVRIAKETVSIYSASIGWSDIKSKMHGNFLDLPPYSTYYLYLPYVGVVPLDGHLFHKRGIKVNYKLDLPTGIATVGIYEKDHNSLIQEYQAQMAVDIPFALTDTLDTIKKAVDSIGSIATSAITSATAVHTLSKTQKTPSTGTTALLGAKIAVDGFKSLSNDISDSVDLKGNITATNALKMFQKPTIIIETVNASYPKNYGKIVGYPCNAKKQLKNLSGFTTCVDPQITFSNGSPTSAEISDIYNLLKEGVIL